MNNRADSKTKKNGRNKPDRTAFQGQGLPIVLDPEAIVIATHGVICRETAATMLRSQEIKSFVMRRKRVCRREDFLAYLDKLASTAA